MLSTPIQYYIYACARPRRLLAALVLAIVCQTALAQTPMLLEQRARQAAREFFAKKEAARLPRAAVCPDEMEFRQRGRLYELVGNRSFVWLSGREDAPVVVGYGMAKQDAPLPPALAALRSAAERGTCLEENAPRYTSETVAPLLTTVRHQSAPYNNACPYYIDDKGVTSQTRCIVGCVATALEQIITYYRRPVTLRDTLHGWETEHYVIPDVLPGATVDTRLILDNYDLAPDASPEAIDAVARLSYYCGVAAKMQWGLSSSGAHSRDLAEPMRRAFGYGYVHHIDSYEYDADTWWRIISGEIEAGRPVYYAGSIMRMGGHAFVLDGLDGEGFVHVNWGYGGDYDGYFFHQVLAPWQQPEERAADKTDQSGFYCNQEAILLHPDAQTVELPQPLHRTGREIALDSVRFGEEPLTGRTTPIYLYVRNTSDLRLTTPFELFTNLPTDTALFKQADYLALTGVTLNPGECRCLTVHATFKKTGERIFAVSPDDSTVLCQIPVNVTETPAAALTFGVPEISFPETGAAFISQAISNASEAGRSGVSIVYHLYSKNEGDSFADLECERFAYIAPGENKRDTLTLRHLLPGGTYELLVRNRWPVAQSLTFTLPAAPSGIGDFVLKNPEDTETWYSIDGRKIARPDKPGIYLRRKDGVTRKVYKGRATTQTIL